jgi:predicted  nucleic acid-binding Zn-ribbon protein
MTEREEALSRALLELKNASVDFTLASASPLPVSQRVRRRLAVAQDAAADVLEGHRCSACKRYVNLLEDGTVRTHDHPPPCRAVCPGSGRPPLAPEASEP